MLDILKADASNDEIEAVCTKLRIKAVGQAVRELCADPQKQLSVRETAVELINAIIVSRNDSRFSRDLRNLSLSYEMPVLKDLYANHAGLSTVVARELCTCEWIRQHKNMLISGPVVSGKTWIGDMLAVSAVSCGLKVFRRHFSDLSISVKMRDDIDCRRLIKQLLRCDLIYIDAFGQVPLDARLSAFMQQLVEAASGNSSVLVTTILDQDGWAKLFKDDSCGINNYESIYSRLTGSPAIWVKLSNSYYKASAPASQSAKTKSGEAEGEPREKNFPQSPENFPPTPENTAKNNTASLDCTQKCVKTSQKGKLQKADINAENDHLEGKNRPKREAKSASLPGKQELPSEGSSPEAADPTINSTDGQEEF